MDATAQGNDVLDYKAQVASFALTGEVTLKLTDESLLIASLLDTVDIPYAEINELAFIDYEVIVLTDTDRFTFSKMGNWGQPFYRELLAAYNKAVLKALFTTGAPLITSEGGYHYREEGVEASGQAPIQVFENCVCVLPPDLGARRVPLHFLTGLDKGDFALTHRVDDDEYTFSKLGHETDPFEGAVIKQTKALREKTQAMIQEIDPTLSASQATQLAKLMPGGAATSRASIEAIAPSLIAAAEEGIAKSRSAEYYEALKEISDPASMYIGFIKNEVDEADAEQSALPIELPAELGGMLGGLVSGVAGDVIENLMGGDAEAEEISPYVFYVVAPSKDKSVCAVEFAVPESESAATFVYRCDGGADAFAGRLNRAMEAVDYARDVISMPEEKLGLPENRRYAMAVKRSPALAKVREGFLGRVIHSSLDTWKKNVEGYFIG
ncbi:MAG: hypothetical protein FWE87_01635 [Coriobacteriia bacterium]|nr:hypothetical protein [Coriobacteriia bacterium]